MFLPSIGIKQNIHQSHEDIILFVYKTLETGFIYRQVASSAQNVLPMK